MGKHILLAKLRKENAGAAAKVLSDAGYEVSTTVVDVSSRKSILELVETSKAFGGVTGLINAAGVSPSQASPETIFKVDLCGTAVVLEEFYSNSLFCSLPQLKDNFSKFPQSMPLFIPNLPSQQLRINSYNDCAQTH